MRKTKIPENDARLLFKRRGKTDAEIDSLLDSYIETAEESPKLGAASGSATTIRASVAGSQHPETIEFSSAISEQTTSRFIRLFFDRDPPISRGHRCFFLVAPLHTSEQFNH